MKIKDAIDLELYGMEFALPNNMTVILVKAYKFIDIEGRTQIEIPRLINKHTWEILSETESTTIIRNN